ncbi:hypothetical protein JQ554_30485 [Bradyrhizobium diazoefficiens]|nr:hypothetical protein [Bradyrhizobium diazoefficiens]MBR0968501.1 hypothetical protein [Bradyrhizobium diazoefficiens]MBR0981825.1 hypothetical protein [Bradyrhizobium diazoefficiens]MBR1011276.1 hypothetical protein [Bradyrhizobium diazoefficiens]MBR1015743.1 hypothetical protein [Bradyrhizobium diazoefficiens]MBR1055116.1 hypothetical protein [Bradyrhizobium diazoefficiens]
MNSSFWSWLAHPMPAESRQLVELLDCDLKTRAADVWLARFALSLPANKKNSLPEPICADKVESAFRIGGIAP